MHPAALPGEPQIPPPPDAPEGAGCEAVRTALCDLLWLAFYVTFMRLLGYRFRRHRPAAPPRRAPIPPPAPRAAAPARPRRKHRYLDREACLAQLARINSACAPAPPPLAATILPPAARRARRASPTPHPRAAAPRPAPRRAPVTAHRIFKNPAPAPGKRTPILLRYRNELDPVRLLPPASPVRYPPPAHRSAPDRYPRRT
jgi:hypothetical protein